MIINFYERYLKTVLGYWLFSGFNSQIFLIEKCGLFSPMYYFYFFMKTFCYGVCWKGLNELASNTYPQDPCIWASTSENLSLVFMNNEGTDQPAYLPHSSRLSERLGWLENPVLLYSSRQLKNLSESEFNPLENHAVHTP